MINFLFILTVIFLVLEVYYSIYKYWKRLKKRFYILAFFNLFSFYDQFVNDLQFKSNYGKIVSWVKCIMQKILRCSRYSWVESGLVGRKKWPFWRMRVFLARKWLTLESQLLLKCLEVNQGETVLDVGCGYGPLGLSLTKAYGVQATMVDINNRALDLARQNAERK